MIVRYNKVSHGLSAIDESTRPHSDGDIDVKEN